MTLTDQELEELIARAIEQYKGPIVWTLITTVATGIVASFGKDGIIYVFQFFYCNRC